MKILHTSDWHLGHQLYGYDRTDEQLYMLEKIAQIVAEEKPDVLLISGDVFHVSQPSASVQKLFVGAILNISRVHPEMRIVITAGNHDSGSRHEIFRTPWSFLGVDVIGTLHPDEPKEHIIEIENKGFIIAIPFANERFIPQDFFQRILEETVSRNVSGMPIVMMAHTTVRGADFTGHEYHDDKVVGGIEGVDVSQFGTGYDYLALGHIHHEQFVHTGKHNVRYSGTPLAVSFDESYPHSVSIGEIESHGIPPQVRKIEIEAIRPLVNLPIDGYASWEDAKRLLKDFPDDVEAYIRLNVEVDNFLPAGAVDEARRIASSKRCRFCLINERRHRANSSDTVMSFTVSEFKEISPIELAKRYVEEKDGVWTDEMATLFREAMNFTVD